MSYRGVVVEVRSSRVSFRRDTYCQSRNIGSIRNRACRRHVLLLDSYSLLREHISRRNRKWIKINHIDRQISKETAVEKLEFTEKKGSGVRPADDVYFRTGKTSVDANENRQ